MPTNTQHNSTHKSYSRRVTGRLLSLLTFFRLYSWPGGIVLVLLGFYGYQEANRVITLWEILQEGEAGVTIIDASLVTTFNFFLWLMLIFGGLYVLIGTMYVLSLRFVFMHMLREKQYLLRQHGSKVVFQMPVELKKSGFFLVAEIVLCNTSSGGHPVMFKKRPRGVLSHNRIVFDVSGLDTGEYSITRILFFFQEPITLFKACSVLNGDHFHPLRIHKDVRSGVKKVKNSLAKKDSAQTIISRHPKENLFATREYHRGDDVRRIHWKNTAKQQRLIVRMPEDESLDDSDVHIILNLYTPFLNTTDQMKPIGKFLDMACAYIVETARHSGKRIHVHINSSNPITLERFDAYDPTKMYSTLISHAYFQDQTPFQTYFQQEIHKNPVTLSLSSDTIPVHHVKEVYIYNMKDDMFTPKNKVFKTFLFHEKINEQGISLSEELGKLEFMSGIKKFRSLVKLRKLLDENEKTYADMKYMQFTEN